MADVTIIIPVAPHHEGELLERALASVQAQSLPVTCLYIIDESENGPAFVRNRLLEMVQTKYTVFLDADDWLEPTFVAECLSVIQEGRYVYTDWFQGDKITAAPEKAWCGGTWHLITSMVHTKDARNVGGFDETLPALEDTDFWLKFVTRRMCGIRIEKPLSHYSSDGLRAKMAHSDGTADKLKETIMRRYTGLMGCCGDQMQIDNTIPIGTKQDGDVLAMAMWRGNRQEYGRATGRRYPRMSNPRVTWVSPRDILARPDLWQEVVERAVSEPLHYIGLDGFTEVLRQTGTLQPDVEEPVIAQIKPKPNVKKIAEVTKNIYD